MGVLVILGPIDPDDVPGLCERVRRLQEDTDAEVIVCDVRALASPDAVTVDALARMQLTARRLGAQIRLCRAPSELRDLLVFIGLGEVVPVDAGLRLEPRGQAEQGEQAGRVEERVEGDDPVA